MSSIALIKQALATKGKANLPFTGQSMRPTLKSPLKLTISHIAPSRIRPSDIIVYAQKDTLVAHRVIEKIRNNGGYEFITKGDNQPFGGISHVMQKDLIGKVECAANSYYSLSYLFLGRMYLFYKRRVKKHLPASLKIVLKAAIKKAYFIVERLA